MAAQLEPVREMARNGELEPIPTGSRSSAFGGACTANWIKIQWSVIRARVRVNWVRGGGSPFGAEGAKRWQA